MSLLIVNGRVLDPANGVDAIQDVLVTNGRIASWAAGSRRRAATETIDATGKVVCPGLIDIHVHLREPGHEYKETIASGTRAAAAGGFTAVCCMANTLPVNDNRAVTDYILARARVEGVVRVYPIGAVTKNLEGTQLAEMAEQAEAGCVAFSDDGKCVMNAELYRRAMEYALPFGTPIISHAEDCHLARDAAMNEGLVSTELGLSGQPAAAEDVMVARDIVLAELTGAHLHIAHISTAGAVRMVRDAKARGVRVTAEATPHHLLLTDEAVRGYDPNTKMAPPLRGKRDVEALVEALADGTVDCIATDHAPHATVREGGRVRGGRQRRGRPRDGGAAPARSPRAAGRHRPRHAGDAPLRRAGPAAAPSRRKPGHRRRRRTSPCSTSSRPWTVKPAAFRSRSRNTPFAGATGRGVPWMTIVAGAPVKP